MRVRMLKEGVELEVDEKTANELVKSGAAVIVPEKFKTKEEKWW